MKILTQKRITLQEIGLYAKVISLDCKPKDNEELAKFITEHFNVLCTAKDLDDYKKLYNYNQEVEDYELENRKQQFNLEL
jgi:hypothetical protein